MERYQRFYEMANIDVVGDLKVDVYNDHDPAHFHVIKKDKYEVRLNLEDLSVMSYKWQKNNSTISTSDIKKLKDWLEEKNKKNSKITNKEAIEFAWAIMNP